ncbi:hypothetical protein E0Z10_g10247 [Xylaria hypoxylon]|uniref:Uncharacterized protein n=1 Tax=Xylaria hypoxylon TaxID=37992 RepID=A0A4Z0Y3G7_9PEZI|nr:hypothetical protein E0Z10_g10247 [Xylaria hypoxylon]
MAQTNSPKPDVLKHTTASSSTTSFTPEMRDRQARGKNPYDSDSDDSDWVTGQGTGTGIGDGNGSTGSALGNAGPQRVGARKRDEPFIVYDRRRMAAQILDSPELLMMAAVRDNESIPATRLKYTRVLCGVEEQSTTSTRTGAARPSTAEIQRRRSNLEQGQGQRSVSVKGGEIS